MPNGAQDAIGDRGEAVFHVAMTAFHGKQPLFRVRHLGEKWPRFDYFVELVGPWKKQRPFFFVQVKATQAGYTRRDGRLKAKIDTSHARQLLGFLAPVYVAGVDEPGEAVYIIAAVGRRVGGLPSMHAGFEVNRANRRLLWTEVRDFWRGSTQPRRTSVFVEPRWR